MIRPAVPADVPEIARLIRALAAYEKLAHGLALDERRLAEHLFGPRPYAEVLVAGEGGRLAGYALFFHKFSTFLACPSLHLEDLFVEPAERGKGHGKGLFAAVARVALDRGCARLDWEVLDWNEPAIGFYRALGAEALSDWTAWRMTGEPLRKLAAAAPPRQSGGGPV